VPYNNTPTAPPSSVTDEIGALARHDKGCERLMTVPGIGPLVSLIATRQPATSGGASPEI
jgi:hypothetical protein